MQFLLFLAVVVLVITGFYAKKSSISSKAKVGIFIFLALLIALGWQYEAKTRHESEENRAMISAFKQGKTLYCDEREISSATFVFVSGTLSFIANDKNQNDKGIVIDMATCKLEKNTH